MSKIKNLLGKRFGRWIILSYDNSCIEKMLVVNNHNVIDDQITDNEYW